MYQIDDFGFTKGEWKEKDNYVLANGSTLCVCHIQNIKYDKHGKEIRCAELPANVKLITAAPKMLQALILQQQRLEMLINLTPTGDLRNQLCDENIALMQLFNDIKG